VTHEALKKRIEKLEEKGPKATDVVMWSPSGGGIFGHVHVKGKREVPCSDEEEIKVMQGHYEIDKHRIGGNGEEVPFWQYLEAFRYLAPTELTERQRTVIDNLRGL